MKKHLHLCDTLQNACQKHCRFQFVAYTRDMIEFFDDKSDYIFDHSIHKQVNDRTN